VPLGLANILIAAIWYEFIYRPPSHRFMTIPLWLFDLSIDVNGLLGWLVTLPIVWFACGA
jgi:hypothetical protein